MTSATEQRAGEIYTAYSYSYPHKTAYRQFAQPLRLRDMWANEPKDNLFLYIHVPFCEMRCGFCNLFTTTNPGEELTTSYLSALRRQAEIVKDELGESSFARMAVGGGTPTFFHASELEQLFDIACKFGADSRKVPVSIEVSPATVDKEKLQLLYSRGIHRVSIGVQSFDDNEVRAAGRPQRVSDVHVALASIREFAFPVLNIDLIYGLPGQTDDSWLNSLRSAISYRPEEIYLYPLYVRPMTGLGKSRIRGASERIDDGLEQRLLLYRAGRDFLRANGYKQISMRMFQAQHCPANEGPLYCCQNDGMVGLGCGARSYTKELHYSSEYAVGNQQINEIIAAYVASDDERFRQTERGIRLSADEQQRRFVIQSLLQVDGLDTAAYTKRFGSNVLHDFPSLNWLVAEGLATVSGSTIQLSESGVEQSDKIGFDLYSAGVVDLMREYQIR
jgi:oxygen-independent coproporphyrinogen-3 oxidase